MISKNSLAGAIFVYCDSRPKEAFMYLVITDSLSLLMFSCNKKKIYLVTEKLLTKILLQDYQKGECKLYHV